jgi:outer membrane protein TolC
MACHLTGRRVIFEMSIHAQSPAVIWVSVLFSLMAVTADAETTLPAEAPSQAVTLEQLIQGALRKSPGLQAKRRTYEAAQARVIAAWLPNDPEVGVDLEGQSELFKFSGRSDDEYMVSQTIPFPTKLLLRGQMAMRESQTAYQQYKEAERDVIWHIEQPYYELYLARTTLAALEAVRDLLGRTVATVQAGYEANAASQQDLLKANIELAKVDVDIFNVKQQAHLAEAHFSHILNEPLETRYAITPTVSRSLPVWSHAELEQLALKIRPELQAVALGIRQAKTSRLLAATSWLPDITGRIETRRFRGQGGSEYDTFVGVTVPVWSLLKGVGGEWRSAARQVEAAEALYHEVKNEVLLAIHEAYAKVQSADYAVKVYERTVLPQAKQQVEVAFASYEAGRSDVLHLIDAQRMFKDAQMAYYKVKAEYERGLSDLRLAVGGELPPGDPAPAKTQGAADPQGGFTDAS